MVTLSPRDRLFLTIYCYSLNSPQLIVKIFNVTGGRMCLVRLIPHYEFIELLNFRKRNQIAGKALLNEEHQ